MINRKNVVELLYKYFTNFDKIGLGLLFLTFIINGTDLTNLYVQIFIIAIFSLYFLTKYFALIIVENRNVLHELLKMGTCLLFGYFVFIFFNMLSFHLVTILITAVFLYFSLTSIGAKDKVRIWLNIE